MDIVNKKFNRWTVISKAPNDKTGHTRFLCKCECGNTSLVLRQNLISGTSKSCGCLAKELSSKRAKHGEAVKLTKLYAAWRNMNNRCRYKGDASYQYYGERGIKVCDRWKKFENFRDDMPSHPGEGYSLDRIDSNAGYSKDNCRWATASEQQKNQNHRTCPYCMRIFAKGSSLAMHIKKNHPGMEYGYL